MPQLDPHSYASQLFWLVVFSFLLFGFLRFVGLPRVMAILQERRHRIGGDIEAAEGLRGQAAETMKVYEATLADAHGAARKLLAETHQANAAILAERTQAAAATFERDVAAAVERVESAQAEALRSIRDVAVGLAADITLKVTGRKPGDDSVQRAVDAVSKLGVA